MKKTTRFLIPVFLAIIISVSSGFILSYTAKKAEAKFVLIPKVPNLIADNFENPPTKLVSHEVLDVSDVAWKTFVTLNWPANYDGSSLKDKDKAIGMAPSVPRVWEFYRTPEEVFLPNGKDPDQNIPNPFARSLHLDIAKGKELLLGKKLLQKENSEYLQDIRDNLQKVRECITIQKLDDRYLCIKELGESKNKILSQIPIVDRQGNYILIEIHLNNNEFKQIVDNKWYKDDKEIDSNKKEWLQFKSTDESDAPIEIKAAWRVFDERSSQDEKNRYYITKRIIAIPANLFCTTNNCAIEVPAKERQVNNSVLQEVEVGLIGFHIAYKIPNQETGAAEWIWATFEQVDNLEVKDHQRNKVALKPTLSTMPTIPNYPYVEPPFLWRDQAPHAVTIVDGQIKQQIPTQVVRWSQYDNCKKNKKLGDCTKEDLKNQNEIWQQAFKKVNNNSVWQYYKLIGTQWLDNPLGIIQDYNLTQTSSLNNFIKKVRNKNIRPKDEPLFNVAMEGYLQNEEYGDSCIGCHVGAKRNEVFSDFSFLLGLAKEVNK